MGGLFRGAPVHAWLLFVVACGNDSVSVATIPVTTQPQPVECRENTLIARRTPSTSGSALASVTFDPPFRFVLPAHIPLTSGNAGNHPLDLTLEIANARVVCHYRGGAQKAHPTEPGDIAAGREYNYDSCQSGAAPTDVVAARTLTMETLKADNSAGPTTAVLSLVEQPPCQFDHPFDATVKPDGNISNPAAGNSPIEVGINRNRASETRLLWVESTGLVVAAYNDESGVIRITYGDTFDVIQPGFIKTTNKLLYFGPSVAGLSVSYDRGITWKRIGVQQPAIIPVICHAPRCVEILGGDPYLATDGTTVLYTNLAVVAAAPVDPNTDPAVNGIAVLRSLNGGVNFLAPVPAVDLGASGATADRPSVAMAAGTGVVAYTRKGGGFLHGVVELATSDDGKYETWDPPQTLPPLSGDAGSPFHRSPIVALVSPLLGYVAYVRDFGVSQGIIDADFRVARLTRGATGQPWMIAPVYRGSFVKFDAVYPGSNVWPDRSGNRRDVDDAFPISFEVGGASGRHLFLAYRRFDNSRSHVLVVDCDDGGSGCTGDEVTGTWRPANFVGTIDFAQYTPVVNAPPGSDEVSVIWYEVTDPNPSDPRIDVFGVFSQNGGTSWSVRTSLSPPMDALAPWRACATPYLRGPVSGHYYGNYNGSAIIPPGPEIPIGGAAPWIVSAHTFSSTCEMHQNVTFDQHVRGVVW